MSNSGKSSGMSPSKVGKEGGVRLDVVLAKASTPVGVAAAIADNPVVMSWPLEATPAAAATASVAVVDTAAVVTFPSSPKRLN